MFKYSDKSKKLLSEVHPDLQLVMNLAIRLSEVDFGITEGLRSATRQAELVKAGKSQTNNSRHLTGHAVDVVVYINGKVDWTLANYKKVNEAVQLAANFAGVSITWGGSWKSLVDGPHFELDRKTYP